MAAVSPARGAAGPAHGLADTLAVEDSPESLRLYDAGALDRLRRAVGDVRLRPWRVTPERFAAYLAGLHAIAGTIPKREARAAQLALDPERHPEFKPWASREALRAGEPDPARLLAAAMRQQPAVAGALMRARVPVDDWAATQTKMIACARALSFFIGAGGEPPGGRAIRAWLAAQRPRAGAEAEFAESLVAFTERGPQIDAAVADTVPARGAAPAVPFRPIRP